MRILVIEAHPDDEVIGAGGTIAKYARQGDEVYLIIVTKAYAPDWPEASIENQPKEVAKVNEILGIKKTFFLDLPTVKLDTIPQKELNEKVSKCIAEVQPDIVYTTNRGDLNEDHRRVFYSTMVATRPISGSSVRKVLSYEVLSSTEWAGPFADSAFIPNVYVDISDTLEIKLKAMAVYKSELKEYPHPGSLEAISILAKRRGASAGVKAAEAFMLIRDIWV